MYSRGPSQVTKRLDQRLASLITQKQLCGGDKCNRRKCVRCNRGRDFRRKEGHGA